MANPTRARNRKRRTQPRGCTYRRALSARTTGGQGVRREAGSERPAEKYRAVIEGSHPHDEPVGQRWGEVEPALVVWTNPGQARLSGLSCKDELWVKESDWWRPIQRSSLHMSR